MHEAFTTFSLPGSDNMPRDAPAHMSESDSNGQADRRSRAGVQARAMHSYGHAEAARLQDLERNVSRLLANTEPAGDRQAQPTTPVLASAAAEPATVRATESEADLPERECTSEPSPAAAPSNIAQEDHAGDAAAHPIAYLFGVEVPDMSIF